MDCCWPTFEMPKSFGRVLSKLLVSTLEEVDQARDCSFRVWPDLAESPDCGLSNPRISILERVDKGRSRRIGFRPHATESPSCGPSDVPVFIGQCIHQDRNCPVRRRTNH